MIDSGAHVQLNCDQLVLKGHVLLAVIKPHVSHICMYVLFVRKVKLKGSTMQKLMTSTTKEEEGLLKIHANLFMYTNTLHLYTIHSILYRSLIQDSREYYTGTNMYKKQGRMGKQSYVCLQSHFVLCQLEWVRSGRWSPSVGLLTCRADSGWT